MVKMRILRFKLCRRLGLNVIGYFNVMKRVDNGSVRNVRKFFVYGI